MEFSKEFMVEEMLYSDMVIYDKIVETSRWSELHEIVFTHDSKFYKSHYSRGLTECQDESPYEYDGDMIEVVEVKPVEVVATKYIPIGEVE